MTEIRYGGVWSEQGGTSTGMGSQPGPVGGDGWQIVARLPAAKMPAGVGRYAIFVTCRISRVVVSGGQPQNGVIQLCLGTSGGSISPLHEHRIAANEVLPDLDGIQVQFAMVMSASPAIADPFFGATWNNSAGSDFCLYARTYWGIDPQTYAVSFDVADVHWLWWDTDRIPASDILCERYQPATPAALSTTESGIYLNLNQPGAEGEKWLHFFNVVYSPRGLSALNHGAPSFRFGYSPLLTNIGVGAWTPDAPSGLPQAMTFEDAGTGTPLGSVEVVTDVSGFVSLDVRPISGTIAVGNRLRAANGTSTAIVASVSVNPFYRFVTKVGTNGRWGQQRGAGSIVAARLHQGGFWYGEQPAGTFLPALKAADRQAYSGTTSTLVERYTYVGIRLDNLPDVLARTETEVVSAAVGIVNPNVAWPVVYVPLERPATGIVSQTSVITHGIVQATGRQSWDALITTNRGNQLTALNSMCQADASRGEGVSSMAFGEHGLSATQPAIQYRVHFLGGLSAPLSLLAVRDLSIVQFGFVRDAQDTQVEPVNPGNPIIIVPGSEGPDPGALLSPPTAPASSTQESGRTVPVVVEGATGYRRGWPAFLRPRRPFALLWPVLTAAEADAMMAFLAANPAFRYQPPRATAAIAVVQMARPELQQVSGHVFGISLQVAELIVTG